MVTDEIGKMEEERRTTQAVRQARQGQWTCWNEMSEQRKLTWSDIWSMEPQHIKFLLSAAYDQLPTTVDLATWGLTGDSLCGDCSVKKGTLRHILSNCGAALDKYTWRHNQVLEELLRAVKLKCEYANACGEDLKRVKAHQCLDNDGDWQVSCDLDAQMVFPQHIVLTNQRPDLLLWSDKLKKVILMELTVPWEENFELAHERKKTRYADLVSNCIARGWKCELFTVEVGCRGFIGRSASRFLMRVGIWGRSSRSLGKAISERAESASAWIWNQYWLRNKKN